MTTDDKGCRACPSPVVWKRHERTGKAAPIDLYPDPAGNVVLVGDDKYRVLGKVELAEIEAGRTPDPERFTSHYATCPAASSFRGRT